MWRKYGSMPEFYNLGQQDCMQGREGYPLRPGKKPISAILTGLDSFKIVSLKTFFFLFCRTY
jgi:hypothetical protein